MTDVHVVDDVVVRGQRRPAGVPDPFPALGDLVWPAWVVERGEHEPGAFNPCMAPQMRREWNRDAAAASAVQELEQFAANNPPSAPMSDRGFWAREYGTVLWELPNGMVVRGPMTWGEHTFRQASAEAEGRSGVELDWTPPAPGAVPIGTIHTHPSGGHIPSGRPNQPGYDDFGVLTYTQDMRAYYGAASTKNAARLYIAAYPLGQAGQPVVPQINVYDYRNIDEAVTGNYTGPEVNPSGSPCPAQ